MPTLSDVTLVAEVKTQSPFGWKSDKSWDELFELASGVGDIISIHTDARWGGSFELVRKARALTDKPILAKGIHASDHDVIQALEAGADYVLVVGRVPDTLTEQCWLEPNSLAELVKLPKGAKAVWNSRDLATGLHKTETFTQARNIWDGWLCQASNICAAADVDPSADAILVGTHLPEFAQGHKKVGIR